MTRVHHRRRHRRARHAAPGARGAAGAARAARGDVHRGQLVVGLGHGAPDRRLRGPKMGQRALLRTLQQETRDEREVSVCTAGPGSNQHAHVLPGGQLHRARRAAPWPVLAPERVAEAITRLADRPRRHVSVPVGPGNPVIIAGFRLLHSSTTGWSARWPGWPCSPVRGGSHAGNPCTGRPRPGPHPRPLACPSRRTGDRDAGSALDGHSGGELMTAPGPEPDEVPGLERDGSVTPGDTPALRALVLRARRARPGSTRLLLSAWLTGCPRGRP